MMTDKDESLQIALQITGLRSLPDKHDERSKVWLKAIALTERANGTQSYVLVENDGNGKPIVKRDLGKAVRIIDISAIYPYETMDKAQKPVLPFDSDTVIFLTKNGYDKEEIETLLNNEGKSREKVIADRALVQTYIDAVAVKLANEKSKEEEKQKDKIKTYKSRISNGTAERKTSDNRRKNRKRKEQSDSEL